MRLLPKFVWCAGVRLANGESIDAPLNISAMGGHNTVAAIPNGIAPDWCNAVKSLKSGLSYVSLYLGFHGDIRQHGATPANIWLYESDDTARVWERPLDEDAPGHRPEEYAVAKIFMANRLLAQFKRHFPRLAPLIDLHEISTPLSQASFVAADRGAMYGLEMSPGRMRHSALNIRTPISGLLLAGQDATSQGIQRACMGGFMAAASMEPGLWKELRRSTG